MNSTKTPVTSTTGCSCQCRRWPRKSSPIIAPPASPCARIAGLVTCRQRPGSASGVLFLTLEDETGNSNIVVWQRTQQHFRQALMTGQLLMVKGIVESKDNVIHVIAGALYDYTHELHALQVKSRDFH